MCDKEKKIITWDKEKTLFYIEKGKADAIDLVNEMATKGIKEFKSFGIEGTTDPFNIKITLY